MMLSNNFYSRVNETRLNRNFSCETQPYIGSVIA